MGLLNCFSEEWKRKVFVFVLYYYIINYHKFRDLKPHPFFSSRFSRLKVQCFHNQTQETTVGLAAQEEWSGKLGHFTPEPWPWLANSLVLQPLQSRKRKGQDSECFWRAWESSWIGVLLVYRLSWVFLKPDFRSKFHFLWQDSWDCVGFISTLKFVQVSKKKKKNLLTL